MPSMGTPLVAMRLGLEELKQQSIAAVAFPQAAFDEARQLLNDSISEADIIKKITQRFGIGILSHANLSPNDVEDNLNIFKNLFKQLIECKIQR